MRGGDPGHLLIAPDGTAHESSNIGYSKAPAAYQRKDNEWLLVPRHHIFGSDELSLHSPALVERVPKPYVAINPGDATRIGVAEGEQVELTGAGRPRQLPVKLSDELPAGVAAVPIGLPGVDFLDLSVPARIARVAT